MEDTRGDHGLGRLAVLSLRPLLALHPPLSSLTPSGQCNCASRASHPQKSVTLLPCLGGRTTKSTKDMWWHWRKKKFIFNPLTSLSFKVPTTSQCYASESSNMLINKWRSSYTLEQENINKTLTHIFLLQITERIKLRSPIQVASYTLML